MWCCLLSWLFCFVLAQAAIDGIFLRDMGASARSKKDLPPHLIAEVDQCMRGSAMENMAEKEPDK